MCATYDRVSIDPNCWFDRDSELMFTFEEVCDAIRMDGGNCRNFHQTGRPDLSFDKLYPELCSRLTRNA